jgi:hypothetical protein
MSLKPIVLLFAALSVLGSHALTLEELEKSYDQKLTEVRLKKEKSLASLNEGYLDALTRIEAKYQRAGRLDEVLLVKDETKDISEGKWPLAALPREISLDVAAPRKIYLKKRIGIEQDAARKAVDTADRMLELLDQRAASLTKEGDLQQALLARQIKSEIEKDADLISARKLLDNVMSDGISRPAIQIRRYGDNREVIVRYDISGKISPDSPISNVAEAEKNIGDTTAKVLGEFLGAEGYDADPFQLMHKTFDGTDAKPVVLARIIPTFQSRIAEDSGLALSIDPKEDGNWYVAIPRVTPPASTPGTVRVTCRYFVPRENKEVVGFFLSGTTLDQRGKWTTVETLAQSRADSEEPSGIMIYFKSGAEGGKIINPAKASLEKVYLHSIIAEQIKFSAFLVKRFGENGVIAETFDNPAKQPVFAKNGEFVTE